MFKNIFAPSFLGLSLLVGAAHAQVTPHINSGNPSFPFPQFLDYGTDRKTLASMNAPGVTHAEMEQRTREAWQLVCNNTSPYPSTVVNGVQYLYPTGPLNCTCAEGDGYFLLGAALMGDKAYFDGYYMWAHDRGFHGVKRFVDGVYNTPNYTYSKGLSGAGSLGTSTNVLGGGTQYNSAADGDVDMALALLIAYKQWGEHSGIVLTGGDWGGKEINYKEEALRYITAMVDTNIYAPSLPIIRYTTGIIGLDGYMKNGDSWGELTGWALSGYKGIVPTVNSTGRYYFDYSAPAWFRSFRSILEQENSSPFFISQYKRAEASSDWLMGQLYSKNAKNIPVCGGVKSTSNPIDFDFENVQFTEDFRASWRTALNYVWHGNPSYTWNPTTHEVDNQPNTFERDMGVRFAKFLKEPQASPWGNQCTNIGDLKANLTFKGPYTLRDRILLDGTINPQNFPLNWIHGAGAASAVTGQDFELMGEMFRQCVIAWDAFGTGQNLDSKPVYFHEWFRLLGMLTLSGNFHSPENMIPTPNLKVYHKVDKTIAYTGDQVTFTVSYRNYGAIDATGTTVSFALPQGFEFVSSTKGSLSGSSILWNVGTVKGFKTGGLAATVDSMKVTLRVGPNASGRYCTNAQISCTNGLGWTSNEYPNNVTAVMERNCVDVRKAGLRIAKTTDNAIYRPGQDVTYKIKFENSSESGWLNGGRPGVRLSFAYDPMSTPSSSLQNKLKVRLFHDAAEPYIDYGNYRISYFLNDPSIKCATVETGCTVGWSMVNEILEGGDQTQVKISHENLVPGQDANGKWNQRMTIQFAPQLATISQHLQQYVGSPSMIHEGSTSMLRGSWRLFPSNYMNVDWSDDWSWDASMSDVMDGIFFPIGDDYTDPNNLGAPINSWHKSGCQTTTKIMKRVLVEEWDGYTWRRIYGNGPAQATDFQNVVIRDTLPLGLTFKNFTRDKALGVTATTSIVGGRTVVTWSIPVMMANQSDSLVYVATIAGACPSAEEKEIESRAWISSSSTSSNVSKNKITSSCLLTSMEDERILTKDIQILPNPAKDELVIKLSNGLSSHLTVRIKDGKGNEVYQYIGNSDKTLDVSNLANGVYFVEIAANETVSRSKLVVLK